MTIHVSSMEAGSDCQHVEVISPELALVDPELARKARALLPEPKLSSPRLDTAPSAVSVTGIGWIPDELEETVPEGSSRRALIAVAAVTMLALLLFDVRVEVGERPASAEPQAAQITRTQPKTAKPKPTSPAPQTTHARSRPVERKFAWAPTQGASAYHVEFFRGSARIYERDTARPELTLPAHWKYRGAEQSLRPGDYQWYVWAVVSGRRQARAAVQTSLSIPGG